MYCTAFSDRVMIDDVCYTANTAATTTSTPCNLQLDAHSYTHQVMVLSSSTLNPLPPRSSHHRSTCRQLHPGLPVPPLLVCHHIHPRPIHRQTQQRRQTPRHVLRNHIHGHRRPVASIDNRRAQHTGWVECRTSHGAPHKCTCKQGKPHSKGPYVSKPWFVNSHCIHHHDEQERHEQFPAKELTDGDGAVGEVGEATGAMVAHAHGDIGEEGAVEQCTDNTTDNLSFFCGWALYFEEMFWEMCLLQTHQPPCIQTWAIMYKTPRVQYM